MKISDKELLFTSLAQTHWDIFARDTLALIKRDNKPTPQVFISYAWAKLDIEREIQAWLLGLYSRLTYIGVKVLFDIKSMTLGTNIDEFMQKGVDQSDRILIIGTETYLKRSTEATNVQCEVEHIRRKVAVKGTECVIPILYRGQFWTALPALGIGGTPIQILGTDCHDELLYHNNLPILIESLLHLQGNVQYQTLKQCYLSKLQDIEKHGLSDAAVADFGMHHAQKMRDALAMQQEAVNLMLERNAKGHPDYVVRPIGSESASVKLLSHLKTKYSQYTHVPALFGEPMALEEQFINLQIIEEQKQEDKNSEYKAVDTNKEIISQKISNFSSLQLLKMQELFTPANTIINNKQKTIKTGTDHTSNLVLVQGVAGIGKTSFVNFVTRQWALGKLWQEYNWVFSLRLRDLPSDGFQETTARQDTWRLEDWIYQAHFVEHMDQPTFQTLWTWLIEPDLNNKQILFILDGYDEIPNKHPVKKALPNLLGKDVPKILTSRPYGLSDLPKAQRDLKIIGFIDENIDEYVSLYFKKHIVKAKKIIKALKAASKLWHIAHIPVALNVICGILETENDVSAILSKLNTMSDLYETMEMSLLERAYYTIPGKESEHREQLIPLDKHDKNELLRSKYKVLRCYLGRLALEAQKEQKAIHTQDDVNRVLKDFGIPLDQISAKIKELLSLGLLMKVPGSHKPEEAKYEFLHSIFKEYYASNYLLWIAKQNNRTMINDFAKIKLNLNYQTVLSFAAGAIKDKNEFNSFMCGLAAPYGSDMFGNVLLGVMVGCTAENWVFAQQTGWSKTITIILQTRIQGLRERFKRGEINFDNMPRPFWVKMVKQSGLSYQEQTGALDLFPDALKKAKSFFASKRVTSAKFIGWLGLTSPTILDSLALQLEDSDDSVRVAAIDAIGMLGVDAAKKFRDKLIRLQGDLIGDIREGLLDRSYRPPVENEIKDAVDASLSRFIEVEITDAMLTVSLVDSDELERVAVAGAVGAICKLGAVAAQPEFIALKAQNRKPQFFALLTKLLANSDMDVRKDTADAMGKFGSAAAKFGILVLLPRALKDKYRYVREAAVRAVGKLGVTAATPDILALLATLLADSNEEVRKATLGTIRELGPAAATKDILTALAKLLADGNNEVNEAVLKTIRIIGPAAAIPDFLTLLVKLLADSKEIVRKVALNVVDIIGAAASTKDILESLAKLLTDGNDKVRIATLDTIGKLGTVVATKNILESLAKLLANGSEADRKATLNVINRVGSAAATSDFLSLLTKLLAEDHEDARKAAAEAIGKLGAAAATRAIFEVLIKLLADDNDKVRLAIAETIVKLSAAAATRDFLPLLAKLLVNGNEKERKTALYVIGNIGAVAATRDIRELLTKLVADPNQQVRKATAEAIGKLGTAAATKDILELLTKLLGESNEEMRKTTVEAIGRLGAVAATKNILNLLAKMLANDSDEVRKTIAEAIGKLGAAAATNDILELLAKLLVKGNEELRKTIVEAIGKLGAAAATDEFLALLKKMLANGNEEMRMAASQVIGEFGTVVSTLDILVQMATLLADDSEEVRKTAASAIDKYGPAAATKAHLIVLIKLLEKEKYTVVPILLKLVSIYLCNNAKNDLMQESSFPALGAALICGAYMSGNTSIWISNDATTSYSLRGFADKDPLNISITDAQAQWFMDWSTQIIQSLEQGTLMSKLRESEKVGVKINPQKGFAWFESSSSGSSNSGSPGPFYPGFFQAIAHERSDNSVARIEQEEVVTSQNNGF